MAVKIQSTKDVTVNGIKCVIYGASGSGKTMLTCTTKNAIIISAEQGLLSLAHLDIPYIEIRTPTDFDNAYKFCKDSDYDTIIIDSLSEVTENVLEKIRKDMIADSQSGKIDGRQAYNKLAEGVGAAIRNYRDIKGKNVVFIAKMKRIEDEESGTYTFEPYLPGRVLPFNLPYLVDELFCLKVDKKGKRWLQTNTDRKYPCKDRSGELEEMEEANLDKIFEKIKEKKKARESLESSKKT